MAQEPFESHKAYHSKLILSLTEVPIDLRNEQSNGSLKSGDHHLRLVLLLEVIQPHLPVRLPCYDFTPVISPTFGVLLPTGWSNDFGYNFHGVTGGVYKARERIHRSIADQRLLAIPTSCRRVAAYNLNLDGLWDLLILTTLHLIVRPL